MSDPAEFLLARIAEDEAADLHADYCESRGLAGFPCDCWVPARVLAECEAKRRIVEIHNAEREDLDDVTWCSSCHRGGLGDLYPCPTLRTVAVPYADHPDYRDEWRP